jgi:hypothetical protein
MQGIYTAIFVQGPNPEIEHIAFPGSHRCFCRIVDRQVDLEILSSASESLSLLIDNQ